MAAVTPQGPGLLSTAQRPEPSVIICTVGAANPRRMQHVAQPKACTQPHGAFYGLQETLTWMEGF